jgi:hypothetical protein
VTRGIARPIVAARSMYLLNHAESDPENSLEVTTDALWG